jgi:hypothetical protein
MTEATKTEKSWFLDQFVSDLNIKAITMYMINNKPCGIPSNLTYLGSSNIYLIGVAIKSNRRYDIPSKKATNLKIFKNVII